MGTIHTLCLGSFVALAMTVVVAAQAPTWIPLRQMTIESGSYSMARMIATDDARGTLISFGCHDRLATTADTWEWAGSHWSPRDPARVPAQRNDAMFVYDAGRRVVVMFGGTVSNGVYVDDTWEFDGVAWQLRSMPLRPPARYLCAGAYDRSRARVVLYGGGAGQLLGDTWEYDGVSWTQRFPATSPGVRQRHRMVYDESRQRVVLHGGEYAYNQTWEWDGVDWTLRSASGPGLYDFSMAYDRARQRTVAYGHQALLGGGTYEWDGTSWVAGSPPPIPFRIADAMATDPGSGRAVLFALSQQWQWNGSSWVPVAAVEATPTGTLTVQAWCTDTARQRVVVNNPTDFFLYAPGEGTWEWNGSRWQLVAQGPKALAAAMAYDSARGRSVLFGGRYPSLVTSDKTHEWDGNVWVEMQPTTRPPLRSQAAMAYDAARQRCVMFGGSFPIPTPPLPGPPPIGIRGDTWTYDGSTWAQRASGPPGRFGHAMAYDPVRQVVVLFGGMLDTGALFVDTWEWNGSAWSQRFPTSSPPGAFRPSLVFDPGRGVVVLHNSQATGTDLWTYDGTTWTPLPTVGVRVRSVHSALAHDPARQCLLLHGGVAGAQWPTMVHESAALVDNPLASASVALGSSCAGGSPPDLRAPLPYPGHVDFAVEVSNLSQGAPTFVGFSTVPMTVALGPCTLYLGAGAELLLAAVANSFGVAVAPLPIPHHNSLVGLSITAQAVVLASPGAIAGLDLSAARSLTIGH